MSEKNNQHKVAAALIQYAEKLAATKAAAGEGAPDRMTTADGQGGITTAKKQIPHDVGENEIKVSQPADGTPRDAAAVPGTAPDRMTTADGQGGITAHKGTVPTDPGEGEIKTSQPADGEARKAATLSGRAAAIRQALCKASPEVAARFNKSATQPQVVAPQAYSAGHAAPEINLSVDTLAKIAKAMLSTDEGIRQVHDTLEKQAGAEAARAQILDAIDAADSHDVEEQIKSAAYEDLGTKAEAIYDALDQGGVSEQDADEILKQAAYLQEKLATIEHPLMKAAYVQGMDDAALLAAAEDAAGEEGVPPVEEAIPMGGEDLSEEEIIGLLTEMLETGQISEEDIMQAIAATEGAEGGAEVEVAQ